MRKRLLVGSMVLLIGLFMGCNKKESSPKIKKDNHIRGVYVLVSPSKSEEKSTDKMYHFIEGIVNDLSAGDTLVVNTMQNEPAILALKKDYETAHIQRLNFKRKLKVLCDKGLSKATKTRASRYEEMEKQFTQLRADHKSLILLGNNALDMTKDSIVALGDVKVAFADVLQSDTTQVKKRIAWFNGATKQFKRVRNGKELESTLSF